MSMPPPPHVGDPVTATAIRAAVSGAGQRVFGDPPAPESVVDRPRMRAFVEHIYDALDDPLWVGETDVFHDNEPTIAEVVEALLDAARLYDVLIDD